MTGVEARWRGQKYFVGHFEKGWVEPMSASTCWRALFWSTPNVNYTSTFYVVGTFETKDAARAAVEREWVIRALNRDADEGGMQTYYVDCNKGETLADLAKKLPLSGSGQSVQILVKPKSGT